MELIDQWAVSGYDSGLKKKKERNANSSFILGINSQKYLLYEDKMNKRKRKKRKWTLVVQKIHSHSSVKKPLD